MGAQQVWHRAGGGGDQREGPGGESSPDRHPEPPALLQLGHVQIQQLPLRLNTQARHPTSLGCQLNTQVCTKAEQRKEIPTTSPTLVLQFLTYAQCTEIFFNHG